MSIKRMGKTEVTIRCCVDVVIQRKEDGNVTFGLKKDEIYLTDIVEEFVKNRLLRLANSGESSEILSNLSFNPEALIGKEFVKIEKDDGTRDWDWIVVE